MIQGGGFTPGMKQKPTREPVANEAANGVKNKHYTWRWRARRIRIRRPRSSSSTSPTTHFLDYKAPSAQHYGYCVFGKVVGRQGRRRPDQPA